MAVSVTHSTPADGTFSAAGQAAWDAAHTLGGLGTGVETALGVNVGSTGAVLLNGDPLVGSKETLATGTITASTPVATWTQTWNSSGVTFKGVDWTFTDTASASDSLAVHIKGGASGTTDLLKLTKGGKLQIPSGGSASQGSKQIEIGTGGVGMYDVNGSFGALSIGNGAAVLWTSDGIDLGSGRVAYGNGYLAVDVATARNADGVLEVNNGTLNTYRDLRVRAVRHNGYAFASLPTGVAGMTAYVTDSTVNTWGSTIAGGGSNKVLAFYNGTNWTVAGA